MQIYKLKGKSSELKEITLSNKYKIKILDEKAPPNHEFINNSIFLKEFNILKYYNENFKKDWEKKQTKKKMTVTNKKIKEINNKDKYLEYYIKFMRFEYVRRNPKYLEIWNEFNSSLGVIENDEGQSVIVYSEFFRNNILLATIICREWCIDYPYCPLKPLPKDYYSFYIYDQLVLGFDVSVVSKNEKNNVMRWRWYDTYSISSNFMKKNSLNEYFYISYTSKKPNSILLDDMFEDENNNPFIITLHDFINYQNKKPYKLYFIKCHPLKFPLQSGYKRIVGSVDLTPYHSDEYEIKIFPIVHLKNNNINSNYVKLIHPSVLADYHEMSSNIEECPPYCDFENWDFFAINKNAGRNKIWKELSAKLTKLEYKDFRGMGFNLRDHINFLRAWDMRNEEKTYKEIAEDLGPAIEGGNFRNPKTVLPLVKKANEYIFDKEYNNIKI